MKLLIMSKESTESCMISVQNHQQPLSGNKKIKNLMRNTASVLVLITLSAIGACFPKPRGGLRGPVVAAGKADRASEGKPAEEGKVARQEPGNADLQSNGNE